MERARIKRTLIAAALAAAFLPPCGSYAGARKGQSIGGSTMGLDRLAEVFDESSSIALRPSRESSDDLGPRPRFLAEVHERVAPRLLGLSRGRDGLPEASVSSKPDPEQGREESRLRMGRRRRLTEVSADGRDPSKRRPTAHRDTAPAYARREILLL